MEEERLGTDTPSLSVTVRVNRLCAETGISVLVTFGARPEGGGVCEGRINISMTLSPGNSTSFSVDCTSIPLEADETYCYFINGFIPQDNSGTAGPGKDGEGEKAEISIGAALGFTLALSVLVTLPVGVALGCCGGVWCVMRRREEGEGRKGEKREMGAIYEEPMVETAISLADNQAYGQIHT